MQSMGGADGGGGVLIVIAVLQLKKKENWVFPYGDYEFVLKL